LGIRPSPLGEWVRAVSEDAKVPAPNAELLRENARLLKGSRILREASGPENGGDVLRMLSSNQK
jgi:hypothetical protein